MKQNLFAIFIFQLIFNNTIINTSCFFTFIFVCCYICLYYVLIYIKPIKYFKWKKLYHTMFIRDVLIVCQDHTILRNYCQIRYNPYIIYIRFKSQTHYSFVSSCRSVRGVERGWSGNVKLKIFGKIHSSSFDYYKRMT